MGPGEMKIVLAEIPAIIACARSCNSIVLHNWISRDHFRSRARAD